MIRLTKCACEWEALRRVHRPLLLRAVPGRRLYYCNSCESYLYADPRAIEGSPQWHAAEMKVFTRKVHASSGKGTR